MPARSQRRLSLLGLLPVVYAVAGWAAEPPCAVTLDDSGAIPRVLVAGRPTDVALPEGANALQVVPAAGGHVFFAAGVKPGVAGEDPRWVMAPTLYKVSCAAPSPARAFVTVPGADFCSAVVAADGSGLFFLSPGGVERLDLMSAARTPIIQRQPGPSPCHDAAAKPEVYDVPDRLMDDGLLSVTRTWRCGADDSWRWDTRRLVRAPGTAAQEVLLWHDITHALKGPGGDLWVVGDGEVWRSVDHGDSWRRVVGVGALPDDEKAEELAVGADGAELLLLGGIWSDANHTFGGNLYRSRDAGVTWEAVAPPEGVGENLDNGAGLQGLVARDGNLRRLRVHNAFGGGAWDSKDGGLTWRPVKRATAPRRPSALTAGGRRLVVAPEGLLWRKGDAKVRVWPPK